MSTTDTRAAMIQQAQRDLRKGAKYAYDHDCEDIDESPAPPAKDFAHAAARGIITDLCDRGGIKRGFEDVEHETRIEIVEKMAEIIRQAATEAAKTTGTAGEWVQCTSVSTDFYWKKQVEAARQPAPVVPEIVEIDAVGILREFVADSHEHDVGGGDLVITTCEVREKAVALLKLLQDPELGECGCKPSDCPNNQKCKCVAATNRSQP